MDYPFWFVLAATATIASLCTALSIRYAHRKRLLDLPGQRRSHRVPTPRGGGIAIVVAMLAGGIAMMFLMESFHPLALALWVPPIVGIALVGWIDDHGGLSAAKRFAMHCIATLWVFMALPLLPIWNGSDALLVNKLTIVVIVFVAIIATVWSINLHNFMDGINGILTVQAIFVFIALALLSPWRHVHDIGFNLMLVCAAACLGFLPFNFPHARIFMGDVGSGTLGFAIALAVLWPFQMFKPRMADMTGIMLCSAFVTDATCTLLSRMLSGRRWYSAHREHLYQWLARSGFSHAQVVALYMGWNLLIVSPIAYWMNRTSVARDDFAPVAAVYGLAVVIWWYGKNECLRRMRLRSHHAAA
ncbi:MAG: glycosyltransferase family 4 protein [Rhodanobacter sp.]|jgi:UDP-N-acetylmuramyl pentapeptide phosphotransferase/UDP-N-acetylglucosamine-1-phosphate transferase|nr:glycosyltransferase family 4 protein [Rhodanobacter sp.]